MTAIWNPTRWPNFTEAELRCKGTGKILIVPEFLDKLQMMRGLCKFPFLITSGYRSPEYNAKVAKTGLTGPHTTGRAVDIAVYGSNALKLIQTAITCGMTGIGVKQDGAMAGRFIHVDDLPNAAGQPRPWIWSY